MAAGGVAAQKALGLERPVYVCPMCMDEKPDSSDLTLEHVPQESLGGKILCLTCRTCNSEAGFKYEGMMPYEPQSKYLIGKIPIKGALGPPDNLLRGIWSIGEGGILDFEVIAKMNDSRKLSAAEKAHKSMRKGDTLQASWQMKYSQDKVNVGHLKNAYLAAFAQFGYAKMGTRTYDAVRKQFKYPGSRILGRYRFYCTNDHPLEKGIVLTRSPVRAMICKWGIDSVFLPAPGDESAEIYKWLEDHVGIEGALNFIVEKGHEWPQKPWFVSERRTAADLSLR